MKVKSEKNPLLYPLVLILFFASACNEQATVPKTTEGLFQIHEPAQTGITLVNSIKETQDVNAITHETIYQGAGVGVINLNNDDLPDLVVIGNDIHEQLYINKGDFKFENVTAQSGLVDNSAWSVGVSVVDFDGDGDDDIYVCKALFDGPGVRRNRLYVNDGTGKFSEQAARYKLDDDGYSIMANWFDYDMDGDLDAYVINQPPCFINYKNDFKRNPYLDPQYTNKLFRNDGASFTNVTEHAGLIGYNYSLSSIIFDANGDNLMDIFVANDYEEPDDLFINQGDGTFKNQIHGMLKHLSTFSMGSDVADIDQDGLLDLYVVDMVAEDNYRQKTNMSGMNPSKFWNLVNAGYHHQYMFNALQLNNGNNSFSEIAQMAKVSHTDWSWASLFNDMDLDGDQDLIVTNGIFKEVRNKDHEKKRKEMVDKLKQKKIVDGKEVYNLDLLAVSNVYPSQKLMNYVFENNGDLTFKKRSVDWGFEKLTWTQGAAYADLDNDGDMDFVLSHGDDGIDVHENLAKDRKLGNHITVELTSSGKNRTGIGSKVTLFHNGNIQTNVLTPYRGFISTCEPVLHFGLGNVQRIDKVEVITPDLRKIVLENVKVNRRLTIDIDKATTADLVSTKEEKKYLSNFDPGFNIRHKENVYDDYLREILIPYKLSSLGPVFDAKDINKDGKVDFYFGGSHGNPGALVVSNSDGTYGSRAVSILEEHKIFEDGCAEFLDLDQDGDLDLYVCSGGNENEPGQYKDRIYLNEGQDFVYSRQANMPSVSSNSIAFDGRDFLFIGGRQVPGQYGVTSPSYLMIKESDAWKDGTERLAPELSDVGMVTEARWADLNGDSKKELLLVGEWMSVTAFEWQGGKLVDASQKFGLSNTNGLWNSLEMVDIDEDGDLDFIAGNLGLNNKYEASVEKPFKVFVDDFDGNGSNDVYLGYHAKDGVCYPVRGRQCSSEQMPFVKKKYGTYAEFASAPITEVLEGKVKENTVAKEAYIFEHSLFLNEGEKGFVRHNLPISTQRAPVYDILVANLDEDPQSEIYMVGNFYDREVETTRSDAGIGAILEWKDGEIHSVPAGQLGAFANRDARQARILEVNGRKTIGVANNNDYMQFFAVNNSN